MTSLDPFLALGFYYYSDYESAGFTAFLGCTLTYFEPFLALGFYSSDDYSDYSFGFTALTGAFLATGFFSSSDSEEDYYFPFAANFPCFTYFLSLVAVTAGFLGAIISSSDSDEDYFPFAAFLPTTGAFSAGFVGFAPFLGCSTSSLLSSDEDYLALLTFFGWTLSTDPFIVFDFAGTELY